MYALPSRRTSIRAPRVARIGVTWLDGAGVSGAAAVGSSVTEESLKGAGTYSPALHVSTRDGTISHGFWLPRVDFLAITRTEGIATRLSRLDLGSAPDA